MTISFLNDFFSKKPKNLIFSWKMAIIRSENGNKIVIGERKLRRKCFPRNKKKLSFDAIFDD